MAQHNSHDARERILKAAFAEFGDKGKYGARMQAIADRAEINKAMLHYYFTNKETLYESVFEYFFSTISIRLGDQIPDEPLAQTFRRFIEAYFDLISENSDMIRLMLRELSDGGQTVRKVIRSMSETSLVFFPLLLRDLLIAGQRNGTIRDVDPVQTMITVIGMSVMVFIGRPLIETVWGIDIGKDPRFLEERREHIVDVLMNGIGNK